MDYEKVKELSASLNDATRNGDIGRAYNLLQEQEPDVAQAVLLRAGFPVAGKCDRAFWAFAQQKVAQACVARVDGYSVR